MDNILLGPGVKVVINTDERKLSLDKVADLTGVSKSMLGQIERGESNPTISTCLKIANGLKISFTDLINPHKSDIVVLSKKEVEPLVEDDGRYKLYPFFPYEDGRVLLPSPPKLIIPGDYCSNNPSKCLPLPNLH